MAREHLEKLQSLLHPLTRALPAGVALECKHFFSGAAAYAQGRICITLTTVGLALKLPEDGRAELTREGAKPLRYFANGPIKKDYVVVPPAFLDDPERLAIWARKSVDYILTLPVPKARKRGNPRRSARSEL